MPLLGHHPIYISLFIGISLINLTRLSIHYKNKSIILSPIIFVMFFQILTLFIISGKATILALIIVAIFIYFHKYQNKTKTALFCILSAIIIGAILFLTPQTRSRFKELINKKTYYIQKLNENNSSQIRIAIWKTSLENIKKAPILGYGIGDVQNVLNSSYKSNYPILLKTQYNSHNQYFGVWLSTGILGLIFFIYFLYFNFKIGFINKDFTFLAILLFFCINFLTENIIERQAGATLFFFFINLFGFYNYSKSLENKII